MATITELNATRQMCKSLNGFEDNNFIIQKTINVGKITVAQIKRSNPEKTVTALFESGILWDTVTNDPLAFDEWVKEAADAQNAV